MAKRWTDRLVNMTHSGGQLALLVVATIAAFVILFALEGQFESLSGVPTFDTQNALTRQTLLEQLPRYQGPALTAYLVFAAFDWVFPLMAGLFLAVLWALLLRVNPYGAALRRWHVPLLPLLATLADYLENTGLLLTLASGGADPWISLALLSKGLKLSILGLSGAGTGLLLVFALVGLIAQRIRGSRRAAP